VAVFSLLYLIEQGLHMEIFTITFENKTTLIETYFIGDTTEARHLAKIIIMVQVERRLLNGNF
jgi:hypothetical protein